MTTYTATYSPDDNKLRLTASARLDADTYARVKSAGFAWAPKLEQFIAPMWTPARADLGHVDCLGNLDAPGDIARGAGVRLDMGRPDLAPVLFFSDPRGGGGSPETSPVPKIGGDHGRS